MSALEKFDHDDHMDDVLGKALSSLIQQGILFTTETTAKDGETIYFIDRVRLTADEIRHLYTQNGLTPDGIRRYLVYRS